ncbi:unnamed protein product [Haemonchus placei]|uniref:DUF4359 domain-containing protein n=1 Tax=Haemonchus placei TaxID=6290 RepID=A0A0N4VXN7_HAEPC|nr:unnamed protein product [Haemonchus placei]
MLFAIVLTLFTATMACQYKGEKYKDGDTWVSKDFRSSIYDLVNHNEKSQSEILLKSLSQLVIIIVADSYGMEMTFKIVMWQALLKI